jgi:hypothetical protein
MATRYRDSNGMRARMVGISVGELRALLSELDETDEVVFDHNVDAVYVYDTQAPRRALPSSAVYGERRLKGMIVLEASRLVPLEGY